MKELMNAKIFGNEIKLVQTDGGTYEVTDTLRDNEIFRDDKVYEYDNMSKAFARYSNIISNKLITIMELCSRGNL